jgi:hypothetical protein
MNIVEQITNAHEHSLREIDLSQGDFDYVAYDHKRKLFALLASKLRHGGTVTIVGVDAMEVSRGFFKGYLNIDEYNSLLRPSMLTFEVVESLLSEVGLVVSVKRFNNYRYYIEAIRP